MNAEQSDGGSLVQRLSGLLSTSPSLPSASGRETRSLRTANRQRNAQNESNIGNCYIFDYQDFKKDRRLGSEKDVERLKHDFDSLNLNVYDYRDLDEEQTLDALRQAARSGKRDHKCFVCCFLTHGSLGELNTKKGDLKINDILNCFSRSNCENLKGVPKIFIFQACRGEAREVGVSLCEGGVPMEPTHSSPVVDIPDFLDFLLIYSTYDGTVAYRTREDQRHGSFFIDEFCRTLEQCSDGLDLLRMLTIVNYRIAHFFVTKCGNKKQMPCFTSSLRTKVEFNKYIPPFKTPDTDYFETRRKETWLGTVSTEKPEADKRKKYKISKPSNIKFLLLLNTENNFENCLLDNASTLYESAKKYDREELVNWPELELMYILKEVAVQDCSSKDCLICFIVCQVREDRLRDIKGKYFQMRKVVEQFAGKFIGKPKIFIFLMSPPMKKSSAEKTECKDDKLIPVHSDLLEVVITVQDPNQLIAVIEKFSLIFGKESSEDFLSQLTRMNEELVTYHGFHSDSEQNLAKFYFHSTLTESLILNKPETVS